MNLNGDIKVDGTPLKDLLPVVLYSNYNGSIDNITLNETSANFKYIELFYCDLDGYYTSTKIYNPNNKKVCLNATGYALYGNQDWFIFRTKDILIKDNKINVLSSGQIYFQSDGFKGKYDNNELLKITKIIGYRY